MGQTKRKASPERQAWYRMRSRCNNKNSRDYKHYGGRGIYVCEQWSNSFENFLSDMGNRPSQKHSIERLDNDGPYSPDNCVWAVQKIQTRNQRRTRRLTYRGRTQSMADWAEELGISYTMIRQRLRLGWSVEDALETPSNIYKGPYKTARRLTLNGESHTVSEWSKILGMCIYTIQGRIRQGLPDSVVLQTKRRVVNSRIVRITFNGKTQTLSQWADETGIKKFNICGRLRKGWSVERALTEPIRVW